MADETQGLSPAQEPERSWQEREITRALHRLASARAQVAALEQQADVVAPAADLEAIERALLDGLEAEITQLRRKAAGRFGGAGARGRIKECMRQQRLVLDRTGFASYDAYRAGRERTGDPERDGFLIEFARREFDEARAAFLHIATLETDAFGVPPSDEAEVGSVDGDGDGDEVEDADPDGDGDVVEGGDNGSMGDGSVIGFRMQPPAAS